MPSAGRRSRRSPPRSESARAAGSHGTRTQAVPGEGDPDTEVVFVGEGPGYNEDRQGRPFVGRAGGLLTELLGSLGWKRDEVFITNVVKCRPPGNRDPEPDEIAACAPYLRRQLEMLDPALVVTLGRLLAGPVHARRAHLAGPRHDPAGRPGDRRRKRDGLRPLPPGRGAADARGRARELRGHRRHARRRCSSRARRRGSRASGRAARPELRRRPSSAGARRRLSAPPPSSMRSPPCAAVPADVAQDPEPDFTLF